MISIALRKLTLHLQAVEVNNNTYFMYNVALRIVLLIQYGSGHTGTYIGVNVEGKVSFVSVWRFT
jgi:hypothetical protein